VIRTAFVLAAGFGSRIARDDVPKPLLRFRGRGLIEWNLLWLAAHGVRDAWVNLHHRGSEIRAALGSGEAYGLRLHYSEEEEILGTAGGWKRVSGRIAEPAFIIYGDNLMRFDLGALAAVHAAGRAACTVALYDAHRHVNTGIAGGHAELSADGTIVAFREGQPVPGGAWLVNAGAYAIEPAAAEWIGEGFQDFGRDVFPALAGAAQLRGHVMEDSGFCLGLDTPECFARAVHLAAAGEVTL
jgi:mannose-1-phosphate guanylyltransferase